MGKAKTKKKCRVHFRQPHAVENEGMAMNTEEGRAPLLPRTELPPSLTSGAEVVPIPDDILKSLPVIPLSLPSTDSDSRGKIKKKDRRKLRHEHWLQKLEGLRQDKEADTAAKERRKTPVVGDLRPLAAALPTLTPPTSHKQYSESAKQISSKSRQFSLLSEVDHFRQVVEHAAFRTDPLDAISQHVRNSVARGST